MKKTALFAALAAGLLITGCSTTTTLTTPEPHSEKYALQAIRIEVPLPDTYEKLSLCDMVSGFSEDMNMDMHTDMDSLLKNPQAVITEYPIAYAAVGETGINDQTVTIMVPESFEPVTNANGMVSIAYEEAPTKVGQYTEWTLKGIDDGAIEAHVWFYDKSLQGMQEYSVAPAAETHAPAKASMPLFKKREMKTEITLAPGNWMSMGGLIREQKENLSTGKTKKTKISTTIGIRILPPANSL